MENISKLSVKRLKFSDYVMALSLLPIVTVDFALRKQFADGSCKLLLVRRNEGAYAGEWFVAGGRQHRGESQINALYRIAQAELGLEKQDVLNLQFSHCQDVYNPESENEEGMLPSWHSVWHFYVIDVLPDFIPRLDSTSSDCMWFGIHELPECSEPVKNALGKAIVLPCGSM